MPNHCVVVNCSSRGRSRGFPISYYRIPAVKRTNGILDKVKCIRREEWLKAINREDIFSESVLAYGRVCSKHFITGKPAKLSARHHIDWTPSVLMGGKSVSTKYDEEIKVLANDDKNVSSAETSKGISQTNYYCCVSQCSSWGKTNPELSYYTFPKAGQKVIVNTKLGTKFLVDRRQMWIEALKIRRKVSDHMRVCSLHFNESDFLQTERTLKFNAVPSKHIPPVSNDSGRFSKSPSKIIQNSQSSKVKKILKKPVILKNTKKQFSANQELLKKTMFKEITDVLTATLDDFNTMTNEIEGSFDRKITDSNSLQIEPNQSDLCNEISKLENDVKNVEGMVVESLSITDSDLKKKLTLLRFENSNLKKERTMLQAKIALLENREIISQIPQTIIYNPRDTPTILLVTDEN